MEIHGLCCVAEGFTLNYGFMVSALVVTMVLNGTFYSHYYIRRECRHYTLCLGHVVKLHGGFTCFQLGLLRYLPNGIHVLFAHRRTQAYQGHYPIYATYGGKGTKYYRIMTQFIRYSFITYQHYALRGLHHFHYTLQVNILHGSGFHGQHYVFCQATHVRFTYNSFTQLSIPRTLSASYTVMIRFRHYTSDGRRLYGIFTPDYGEGPAMRLSINGIQLRVTNRQ